MGKPKGELPEGAGRVRKEIETWRQTRKKRSPMPARLWGEAAKLAEEHGVYRISRAFGLSYDSLRNRVRSSGKGADIARPESSGFVELGGAGLIHPGSSCMEVELCKPDGSRMSVRVSGFKDMDVASIIEGFWSRSR